MADITLQFNAERKEFDINVANADLLTGNDLATAVIISLFTWSRAQPQDDIPEGGLKYGWFGDLLGDDAKHCTGSRLYLLARRKLTQQTINDAAEYIKEALNWLKRDGAASAIDISIERNGLTEIDALITICRTGGQSTELRFNKLWMTIGGGEYGFN